MAVQFGAASPPKANPWLADNPSKRWTELFFLAYSPFWITWALCILVPFKIYEQLDELGYLLVGLACGLPCVVLPLLLERKADQDKPWWDAYWVKANVWIAIFGFVGNYFWTHYFYTVLGASYTFPSWDLNQVPIPCYLLTHGYFLFYHTLSNVLLRRVSRCFSTQATVSRYVAMGTVIFLLAYATAYMETLTIANFPYYSFKDPGRMYTVGSLFYASYFFVSFPMFFRMDEAPGAKFTLAHAAMDSLGAAMLVTILLDLWRISVGSISGTRGAGPGLPWFEQAVRS